MSDDSFNQISVTRPVRPGWSIGVTALAGTVLLFFASQALAGVVIGIYVALQHWDAAQIDAWVTNSVAGQFVYSVLAEGLLIVGIMLLLRWLHWTWRTIGLTRPTIKQLLIGVLAAVPYYALLIVSLAVLSLFIPALNVTQKQDIGFNSVQGIGQLVMTFIGLVAVPAIAEEITMRGFLYIGLKRWLPTMVAALVVSALFGAAHLAEGGAAGPLWVGAIDTFILSMVLIFLKEKTGNLWAGIMLHATKNFVAFPTLFIIGGR